MNFKQLEAFVWVAELQSFTGAARHLYMSQPAISFQIKALEEDLQVTLFRRNEKKVTLTEAGRLLYPEAKQLLGHYQKIKAGLDALRGLQTGQLVVGASTIPGEYLLPYYLGRFHQKYPGVRVKLRIAGSGDVLRWLQEREIDLGVVGSAGEAENLEFVPWLDDELVIIVPPRHRWAGKSVEIGEMAGEKCVLREEGSGTRRSILSILEKHGLTPDSLNVEMELGSTRAVISAVQAGVGIGFVSRWAAADAINTGAVGEVRLLGVNMVRKLYLARYPSGIANYASNAFVDLLQSTT